MNTSYFVIFEEKNDKDRYVFSSSNDRYAIENLVYVWKKKRSKTPLYKGELTNEHQADAVYAFVNEANRTGKFDKEKLENILKHR